MSDKKYTFSEIAAAYRDKTNIMKLLKEGDKNSLYAIQMSYDLQTGSYIKAMSNPEYRKSKQLHARIMAVYIAAYLSEGCTLLEAGTGEATTLSCLLDELPKNLKLSVKAFDISWSRLHYARKWLSEHGFNAELFMASLTSIPLPDNSVDVVFTNHAIEPNHGNEDIIMAELYRIARRAIVLFEPAYELTISKARARMDDLGYCRGLPDIVKKNGWKLKEHKLVRNVDDNPTALVLIEKELSEKSEGYACPLCGESLKAHEGNLFCANDGVVFPIICGIPSLMAESAIIASKYMD